MMSSPYFQGVDAAAAPDPVTPAAAPSSPAGFAGVTPHGQGPAPYDIQAAIPDLSAAYEAAGAANGAGIVYPVGPRQQQAEMLLQSDQGFGVSGFDIDAGFHAGGGGAWAADVEPPEAPAQTPDQGMGDFTGTGTD